MNTYLKITWSIVACGFLLAGIAARAEDTDTNSMATTNTAPRLIVVKAVYGDLTDPNSTADVTGQVADLVTNDTLTVAASNDNFGDPASGICKELRVDFKIDGVPGSKCVYERGTLKISLADKPNPAQNSGKLVIRKAVYDDTDGDSIDVTTIVAGLVRNDSITFKVNDDDLGDPAPDQSKKLQVDYTLNGKDGSESVDEGKTLKLSAEGN
jgi:hypothetical protein